jgi:D-galactarolactone isomerase
MSDQAQMTHSGRKPRLIAPPGACETHSHIYGAKDKYPHHPGRHPDLLADVPMFEAMLDTIGFERAVIVQPSLYSFDNRATLDAIATMGLHRTRGVAVCPSDVSDAELDSLHEQGIRALRFFLLVDDIGLDVIEPMAKKCADRGWHVVVQGRDEWLHDALPILTKLPCPVVIDHLGRTPVAAGVDHEGFSGMLKFLESGRLWVKISAPYLTSERGPPNYEGCAERVRALVSTRPDRLMWAANWPHPGSPITDKPDEADCLDPLLGWAPDEAVRKMILADNPAALYGFENQFSELGTK